MLNFKFIFYIFFFFPPPCCSLKLLCGEEEENAEPEGAASSMRVQVLPCADDFLEEPAVLGHGIHEKPRNGSGMVSSFRLHPALDHQEFPGAFPHRFSRGKYSHEEQDGSIPLAILHPAPAPSAPGGTTQPFSRENMEKKRR